MTLIFVINNISMRLLASILDFGSGPDEWPAWFYLYGKASVILLPGIAVLWLGSLGHALKRLGTKNRNYGWWLLAQLLLPVSLFYYYFVYIKDSVSAQQRAQSDSAASGGAAA